METETAGKNKLMRGCNDLFASLPHPYTTKSDCIVNQESVVGTRHASSRLVELGLRLGLRLSDNH